MFKLIVVFCVILLCLYGFFKGTEFAMKNKLVFKCLQYFLAGVSFVLVALIVMACIATFF